MPNDKCRISLFYPKKTCTVNLKPLHLYKQLKLTNMSKNKLNLHGVTCSACCENCIHSDFIINTDELKLDYYCAKNKPYEETDKDGRCDDFESQHYM